MKSLLRLAIGSFLPLKQKIQVSLLSSTAKQYSCYLGKWELPNGYDSGISVYNSAANKKVPLILKNKGVATWYICGPTVYAESHIGHASCYVKFDVIRRIMENVFNINVSLLIGITDIDDKIIKKSSEIGLDASEISKKYELSFFEDLATMRVKPPTLISRVTENIPHIISFCEKLIEKDYAYVTNEGNVYFMVSMGVSSDILNEMPEETKVAIDPLKKDKRDFALWKAAKENEPYWLSPWGAGRPGWHIECSVMASNVFGSQLDIHSGGYDLLFPHHSNEKSQSEAYHNCSQWVNYWLHSGLLQVGDDIKMSKSIKNTISVKEFLKDNCVNDFRILCLQSPYRKSMSYCNETLVGAKGLHKKFHNFINEFDLYVSGERELSSCDEDNIFSKLRDTKEKVISLLADDFNTSQALLCLVDLIDEVSGSLQISKATATQDTTALSACCNYIDKTLEMFGVNIVCKKRMKKEFVCIINAVTEFRNQIRLLALCQNEKGEIRTATEYIDNALESFNKSIKMMANIEDLSPTVPHILNAVNLMHKKSSEFSVTLQGTNDILGKNHNEKKKRIQLLIFCDELRCSLENYGIAIKDRKGTSTWLPSPTLQL